VDAPPDGSQFKLQDIEVPPPPPPPAAGRSTVKPAKVDWSEVNAYSRKLGEQGERFVLDLEKRRLLPLNPGVDHGPRPRFEDRV
jgi:hypothetical protein